MIPLSDDGSAINVPLESGTSSVNAFAASVGGGYGVGLYGQSGQDNELGYDGSAPITVSTLVNPGSSVRVESVGGGWNGLGVVAYSGDESSGIVTYNWGSAGISAASVAANLGQDDAQDTLSEIAPHVVLVCLGANDFASNTVAQLRASLASIHASLVAAIPNVDVVFLARDLNDSAWGNYADGILAEAATLGVHALDLRVHVPWSTPGAYVSDGVHLTVAGNNAYANALADFLALETVGLFTNMIVDMSPVGRAVATAATAADARDALGAMPDDRLRLVATLPAVGVEGVLYMTAEV